MKTQRKTSVATRIVGGEFESIYEYSIDNTDISHKADWMVTVRFISYEGGKRGDCKLKFITNELSFDGNETNFLCDALIEAEGKYAQWRTTTPKPEDFLKGGKEYIEEV